MGKKIEISIGKILCTDMTIRGSGSSTPLAALAKKSPLFGFIWFENATILDILTYSVDRYSDGKPGAGFEKAGFRF